jgi:long-chain acyl-CoA synthetase
MGASRREGGRGSRDWARGRRLGFWAIAEDEPGRIALVLPDGGRRTFGELAAEAHRIAHGLRALGLRSGDCVALLAGNGELFYAASLAAQETGLYVVPLNWHLTPREIAHVIGDSESRALITEAEFADAARAAADAAALPASHRFAAPAAPGFRALAELLAGQPETAPADRTQGMVMMYTSGTTGKPKGVRRPLPAIDPTRAAEESTVFARAFGLRPFDGAQLVVGPLYHAGPSAFSWGSLHVGHTQVLTTQFDAEDLLRKIDRHRITNTHLVATMFHRLLALPEAVRRSYDLSSLRMVVHSAAPTPIDVKKRMLDWWGPVIWETYGGTEGAATIAKPHHWLAKPGTVGRAVRGVKIHVLDGEGALCPSGTPGAIYLEIEGSQFEYWKDPEKTRGVHRGRTFTLGDVGYVDADGFLFLTGRQSEVIISGGVNIYPAEVEAELLSHPSVGDVAVIGVPNAEWGEEVKAVVQPAAGVDASERLAQELIAFCRSRIAHYKCPRSVDFRAELPRAENGKLYKRRIRDEYWRETGREI